MMMYSNVVRRTWKLPWRISAWAPLRCAGVPLYDTTLTEGAHRSNSEIQLGMVDSGTMTRYGPGWRLVSMRYVMSDSVWIVLPRPISSARMPLTWLL